MFQKKEDRPLGTEFKNKKVRKNTKYFQALEYREIEKKPESVKKETVSQDLLILPIGLK